MIQRRGPRAANAAMLILAVQAVACGSPPPQADGGGPDAAPDAGLADDAALDAFVCTLRPGDLPGERRIAAGALLPNMTFATETGSVSLTDYHAPCAARSELIVVRSLAAWSGLSGWQVAHTARSPAGRSHTPRD